MNYTIEFEIDSALPIYGIYTINNSDSIPINLLES